MTPEDWAKREVEKLGLKPPPEGVSEEEIAAKVRVGLTRDQAIEVILRQREEDAANAGAPPVVPPSADAPPAETPPAPPAEAPAPTSKVEKAAKEKTTGKGH